MSKSNAIHVETTIFRDKMTHKGKMSTNEKKILAEELKRTIPDMLRETLSQVSKEDLRVDHKVLKEEVLNALREEFKYMKLTKYSPNLLRLISLEYDIQVQKILGSESTITPNKAHIEFKINLNLFALVGVFLLGFLLGLIY